MAQPKRRLLICFAIGALIALSLIVAGINAGSKLNTAVDDLHASKTKGWSSKIVSDVRSVDEQQRITPSRKERDQQRPAEVAEVESGAKNIVESEVGPHFDLSPKVCPLEFLEHLVFMADKIARRWKANGWGKRYGKADISQCGVETPECLLWKQLPVNASTTASSSSSVEMVGGSSSNHHPLPYRKCCVEHRQLRDTAWFVTGELDRSNITYFLSTGSALGAIRHGGTIVPWDTDVDIAIFPSDADAVKALFTSEVNARLHFFNKDTLGKPMFWVHHSKNGKPLGGPHVEIFYDSVYTAYPKQLLPLQQCEFYGRRVSCPKTAMFDVWFPGGWQVYGGGHYHGPNRCTIYHKGKRIETDKC